MPRRFSLKFIAELNGVVEALSQMNQRLIERKPNLVMQHPSA
jgi:hypothetical protein